MRFLIVFVLFSILNASLGIFDIRTFFNDVFNGSRVDTYLIYVDKERLGTKLDFLCKGLKVPKIVMTMGNTVQMHERFNRGSMSILIISTYNRTNMELFARSANNTRNSRVLVILNGYPDEDLKFLHVIFKFFIEHHMLNVLAVYDDEFGLKGYYYGYTIFPVYKLEIFNYTPKNPRIYPNRLRNVHGHPLVTLPDGAEPRSIIYSDSQGRQRIGGYIWNLIELYASYINATLQLAPHTPVKRYNYHQMRQFTLNRTIDICTCVVNPKYYFALKENSYPVTYGDWCLMIPQERPMDRKDILLELLTGSGTVFVIILQFVFSLFVGLCEYLLQRRRHGVSWLLNADCFRGVLGLASSFHFANRNVSKRIIIGSIFFTGLVYSTFTTAFLHSMHTQPRVVTITSMKGLRDAGLKILIHPQEYHVLSEVLIRKYKDCFKMAKDYAEINDRIMSSDVSYAYLITQDRWYMQELYQKYTRENTFRFSNICFVRSSFSHFVMPPNSIYHYHFDKFLLRVAASGLMKVWETESLMIMVKSGQLKTNPKYRPSKVDRSTTIDDLYYLFWIFIVGIMLSVLAFVAEIAFATLRKRNAAKKKRMSKRQIAHQLAPKFN